jgi:hypothetical protein
MPLPVCRHPLPGRALKMPEKGPRHAVGHIAAQCLMGNTVAMAFAVAALHKISMTVAGGAIAVAIYMWLGLKFLSRTWFNLDLVWALSLILVGTIGIYSA